MRCLDREYRVQLSVTSYQLFYLFNNVNCRCVTSFPINIPPHWTQMKSKWQKTEFNCNFPCDANEINLKISYDVLRRVEFSIQTVAFYLLMQFIIILFFFSVLLLRANEQRDHVVWGTGHLIFSPLGRWNFEWMNAILWCRLMIERNIQKISRNKNEFHVFSETITHIFVNCAFVLQWNQRKTPKPYGTVVRTKETNTILQFYHSSFLFGIWYGLWPQI